MSNRQMVTYTQVRISLPDILGRTLGRLANTKAAMFGLNVNVAVLPLGFPEDSRLLFNAAPYWINAMKHYCVTSHHIYGVFFSFFGLF